MVMSYTKGIFILRHTVYVVKEFLKISIVEKEIRKTTEECGIKQWLIASVKNAWPNIPVFLLPHLTLIQHLPNHHQEGYAVNQKAEPKYKNTNERTF